MPRVRCWHGQAHSQEGRERRGSPLGLLDLPKVHRDSAGVKCDAMGFVAQISRSPPSVRRL